MFDFTIKADPSQALRAANDVERELAQIEGAARRAGTGITASFEKGASGLSKLGEAAAGFAAGYLSVGAIAGIGQKVLALGADYQQLENRLRSVTTTQSELNVLMDKTHGIADRSRSDWGSTSEAFVRLTNSTKDLGLSQDQSLRLTETLAKATKLQGASSAEASSAMLQLSQALQSGVLAGDEFRTLAETMPDLLDKIAATMGKPRSELKKLAADGQITSAIIVRALQDAAPQIDAAFARMKPTIADAWTKFKNDTTETAGQLIKTSNVTDILSKALSALADGFKDIVAIVGPVIHFVGELNDAFSDIKDALGPIGTALDYLTSPLKTTRAVLGALNDVSKESDPILTVMDEKLVDTYEILSKINAAGEETRAMLAKQAEGWRALGLAASGVFNMAEMRGGGGFFGMGGDMSGPSFKSFADNNALIADRAKKLRELADAAKEAAREQRRMEELFGLDKIVQKPSKYFAGLGGEESLASFNARFAAEEELAHLFDDVPEKLRLVSAAAMEASANARQFLIDMPKEAAKRYAEFETRATDAISGIDRGLKSIGSNIMDIGQTIEKTITGGFQKMNDMLVDGFTTGKFAWKDFARQIEQDLVRIALQIIEMRLLLAIFGGGGGAGMTGIGALFGGSHATGGSFTAPSDGGPDSHLVMFRMSPNERADFTPQGGARGTARTVVQVAHDPRDLLDVLETPAGVARIRTVVGKNPGIVGRNPLRRN